ncbi:MAG: low molecular weight phosphotyrosine protein phosphatase [Phycisphaerales bacterium]|nr:low molecular weight phosphotyrosine protein phosphatase [Phycisphaerales bacterium]
MSKSHATKPSSADQPARTGVLFVCTGNICRSPLAEAIFRHIAGERRVIDQFQIASCGTGSWHAGDDADPRTRAVAARYGIPMKHTARAFRPGHDFTDFPWIIAMDNSHMRWLAIQGRHGSRIHLMREFDPEMKSLKGDELDVPDPYYGGEDGFEKMYHMLDRACRGFLDHLMR